MVNKGQKRSIRPKQVRQDQPGSNVVNMGLPSSGKVNQDQPCPPGLINFKRDQTRNWSTRINQHSKIKYKNTKNITYKQKF